MDYKEELKRYKKELEETRKKIFTLTAEIQNVIDIYNLKEVIDIPRRNLLSLPFGEIININPYITYKRLSDTEFEVTQAHGHTKEKHYHSDFSQKIKIISGKLYCSTEDRDICKGSEFISERNRVHSFSAIYDTKYILTIID